MFSVCSRLVILVPAPNVSHFQMRWILRLSETQLSEQEACAHSDTGENGSLSHKILQDFFLNISRWCRLRHAYYDDHTLMSFSGAFSPFTPQKMRLFWVRFTNWWYKSIRSPGIPGWFGSASICVFFHKNGGWKLKLFLNGCFQKYGYPQIIHFNMVFHYKPSILGYP